MYVDKAGHDGFALEINLAETIGDGQAAVPHSADAVALQQHRAAVDHVALRIQRDDPRVGQCQACVGAGRGDAHAQVGAVLRRAEAGAHGVGHRHGLEFGPGAPAHGAAIGIPCQVFTAHAAQPQGGKRGFGRVENECFTRAGRGCREVHLMPVDEGNMLSVGRELDARGQLRAGHLLHIVATAGHGNQHRAGGAAATTAGAFGAFLGIQAAVGAEVRVFTARTDKLHVPRLALDQIQARLYRPLGVEQSAAGKFAYGEGLAAAVDGKLRILAFRVVQCTRLATARGHAMNTAELAVTPAQEKYFAAIGAPHGCVVEAVCVTVRQALGGIVATFHIQAAQRLEHNGFAVRRRRGEADHAGVEFFRSDLYRKAHGGIDVATAADLEGDFRQRLVGRIQAPELALCPEHDIAAVWRPFHGGIEAVHRPGFLHVQVKAIKQHALGAGREVLHKKSRLRAHPFDVGEALAIRRRGGADRTARPAGNGADITGCQVEPPNLEQLSVAVLVVDESIAGGGVQRKVQALAVGAEGRFTLLFLEGRAGAGNQHLPTVLLAAAEVIQPDFAGAKRARGSEVLARSKVVAVRAPARAVEQPEILESDLTQFAAGALQHPQVVPAVAVGGKCNMAAVGAVLGLHVPSEAAGQWFCGATFHGDFVQVAKQVKRNVFAVRRDVNTHPGTLVHVNRGAGGGCREIGGVYTPAVLVPCLGRGGCQCIGE